MEQNQTTALSLTPEVIPFLKQAAKWAKLIAIIGFIVLGIFFIMNIIASIKAISNPSPFEAFRGRNTISPAVVSIVYSCFFSLLYFIPISYLYKFASGIQKYVNNNGQDEITTAFKNLKSHFKYIGISLIAVIIIYVLFIVLGFIGLSVLSSFF